MLVTISPKQGKGLPFAATGTLCDGGNLGNLELT